MDSALNGQKTGSGGLRAYFLLTYAVMLSTWGVMALFRIPGTAVASRSAQPAPGALLLFLLGGFSPTIAGVVMTGRVEGRGGLRDLWARAKRTHLGWTWYAAILAAPVLVLAARIAVHVGRGGVLGASPLLTRPFGLLGFTLPIIVSGPLSEEFGWRGFALDRLLTGRGGGAADLILGGFWAFWHLPLFFIPGTIQQLHGRPAVEFPIFTLQVLGLTVLFNRLYRETNRSLFAVILAHTAFNWFYSFAETFMNGGVLSRLVNAGAIAALAGILIIGRRSPAN